MLTPVPGNTWVVPRNNWQPAASLTVLKKRAELYEQIRSFFKCHRVLEVDTPVLGVSGVTDVHIDNITASVNGRDSYLQSSPEYYMKRLLAAGCGPIYSLGKAFRDGEKGRRHHPEFTMLEWYRPGWDEQKLIAEIDSLFHGIDPALPESRIATYGELFKAGLGADPHDCSLEKLQQLAVQHCGGGWQSESRSTCLDALFSFTIEPALGQGLVIVQDYPACQAALAQLARNQQGQMVARRFEVFLNGMELGNGYFELTDPIEQLSRFNADNALRKALGKVERPLDQCLLDALQAGLPSCAGVAIGVDRWLMQLLGADSISKVLSFVD